MLIDKSKLKMAREAKGFSKNAVAKVLGVTNQHAINMEAGATKSFSSITQVIKLAKFLGIPPHELVTDEDAQFLKRMSHVRQTEIAYLPLLDMSEIWDFLRKKIHVNRRIKLLIKDPADKLAFKIEGDAMVNFANPSESYNPDEIAIVDTEAQPKNGDVVLAYAPGSGIKIRQYIVDGQQITLHPFNKSYEPIFNTKNIEILGKVIMTYKDRTL